MKKERAIIIKDPRLRKVRNELRILLKLWKSDILSAIVNRISAHIRDKEKVTELNKEITELNLLEGNSITTCPQCGFSNKDMVCVPTEPIINEWDVPYLYTIYTHEWICMECNAKRVYYAELKAELFAHMGIAKISEYLERLSGEEGIGISRFGARCKGFESSKRILSEMGIGEETQDKFFELCGYYSGYCDCEIILNASRHLLK